MVLRGAQPRGGIYQLDGEEFPVGEIIAELHGVAHTGLGGELKGEPALGDDQGIDREETRWVLRVGVAEKLKEVATLASQWTNRGAGRIYQVFARIIGAIG